MDIVCLDEYWSDIESLGVVATDYREKSWAPAVEDLIEGEALFLLFDGTISTTLTPRQRTEIGSVPFPGSRASGRSSFAIGSLFFLAIPQEAPNREGAGFLFEYLTSEGVTERFRRETGVEIFTPDRFPADIRIVPSITNRVREPEMKPFLDWLYSHSYGD